MTNCVFSLSNCFFRNEKAFSIIMYLEFCPVNIDLSCKWIVLCYPVSCFVFCYLLVIYVCIYVCMYACMHMCILCLYQSADFVIDYKAFESACKYAGTICTYFLKRVKIVLWGRKEIEGGLRYQFGGKSLVPISACFNLERKPSLSQDERLVGEE